MKNIWITSDTHFNHENILNVGMWFNDSVKQQANFEDIERIIAFAGENISFVSTDTKRLAISKIENQNQSEISIENLFFQLFKI